jgi:hypothetical protein
MPKKNEHTLGLTKEIDCLLGKVKKLEFNEPTGRHIRKIGMPFRIMTGNAQQEPGVEIDSDKVGKYIEQCCNLGVGDADKLSLPDFIEAQNKVLGFFGQSAE